MPLLIEKIVPGAATCILIGGLRGVTDIDWAPYRAILWWVDTENQQAAPIEVESDRLQIAPLERVDVRAVAATLEAFVRRDQKCMPSIFVTDAVAPQHAAVCRQVMAELYSQLASVQQARITRQLDGFTWQTHVLRNLDAYVKQRMSDSWAGALRGVPAIVTGSGPSLQVSLPRLALLADRAIVISADSALRALARQGVQADFAVSIDAAKQPEKCLPDELRPTRVILSSVSPPAWLAAVPPRTVSFISGFQLTDDWLATMGTPRTAIAARENCGNTAIDLATHLGCDPIYLFGMDLAVDALEQGRTHLPDVDLSIYKAFNYSSATRFPLVPGNYSETVPCFAFSDWEALNRRLANRHAPTVFNVTDRGARLNGVTLIHPDHLSPLPGALDKRAATAALMPPADVAPEVAAKVFACVRAAGERCGLHIPAMREALARGSPDGLVRLLRPILLDADCSRALGAFSLKLMPHLIPPIEGSLDFWGTVLGEYKHLAELAQKVGLSD